MDPSGFLPVIFSWVRAKQQTQPLRLPSDSEEEPAAGAKAEVSQTRLHGWKLLLLWFPAACDLTGTTVRLSLDYNRLLLLMITLWSQCGYTVDECRFAVYPGLDLSDDPWCSRALCRRPLRHLPPQTSLALPVECTPVSHPFSSIKPVHKSVCFRVEPWLTLVPKMDLPYYSNGRCLPRGS